MKHHAIPIKIQTNSDMMTSSWAAIVLAAGHGQKEDELDAVKIIELERRITKQITGLASAQLRITGAPSATVSITLQNSSNASITFAVRENVAELPTGKSWSAFMRAALPGYVPVDGSQGNPVEMTGVTSLSQYPAWTSGDYAIDGSDVRIDLLPEGHDGHLVIENCNLTGLSIPKAATTLIIRNCQGLDQANFPESFAGALEIVGCDLQGARLPRDISSSLTLIRCRQAPARMTSNTRHVSMHHCLMTGTTFDDTARIEIIDTSHSSVRETVFPKSVSYLRLIESRVEDCKLPQQVDKGLMFLGCDDAAAVQTMPVRVNGTLSILDSTIPNMTLMAWARNVEMRNIIFAPMLLNMPESVENISVRGSELPSLVLGKQTERLRVEGSRIHNLKGEGPAELEIISSLIGFNLSTEPGHTKICDMSKVGGLLPDSLTDEMERSSRQETRNLFERIGRKRISGRE